MAKKAARWDSMNKDNTPLEKLVLQYEAFNRSEGKTPKTVRWYNSCLGQFVDYLRSQNIVPVLANVDTEAVREYILHLQKRKRYNDHPFTPKQGEMLSAVSIQCYVRAIKTFFNWLYKEGYTRENKLERLKQPKAPRKLIDPLTEAEIAVILSSIDAQTSWGARNTAIVLLMLDTGLRFTELLTLDMKDLHLEESYLKVMGKGQTVHLNPYL
jgi:site-specific recombinase XerD